MSAEYAPGTVAMVTAYNRREPYRAYFDGKTWREYDADIFCVDVPTTIRPLVVLDPEDREQAERFALGYIAAHAYSNTPWEKREQESRDRITNAVQAGFRNLIAPLKPAEPTGLGAVVEDAEGRTWVSRGKGYVWPWMVANSEGVGGASVSWAQIDAVRVLSEGVTA